jgi:hypothetical protein
MCKNFFISNFKNLKLFKTKIIFILIGIFFTTSINLYALAPRSVLLASKIFKNYTIMFLSPLIYDHQARLDEEQQEQVGKIKINFLKITKRLGKISEIKANREFYEEKAGEISEIRAENPKDGSYRFKVCEVRDVHEIPEVRDFVKAYVALDKAGLLSKKDFAYNFKFYENTPSLASTIFVCANSANFEINKTFLNYDYKKIIPRLLEVIIKEDLRTESISKLVKQINFMLDKLGYEDQKFGIDGETISKIKSKDLRLEEYKKFEVLLRFLSYKKYESKFVELSEELGLKIDWETYRESIRYLYEDKGLLMDDDVTLREQLKQKFPLMVEKFEKPFDFKKQDYALCKVLEEGGVEMAIKLYLDGSIEQARVRIAA